MTQPGERRRIGHIDFTVMTLHQAVQVILDGAASMEDHRRTKGMAIHFANAYNVALASKHSSYAELMNAGDYVFSDGVPITWVGKRAYPQVRATWERVYGPDAMTLVFEQSTAHHPKHYLLGSTPEVLASLEHNLRTRFPNAAIVGSESPPFGSVTQDEIHQRDQRIRDSGATLVWVGLGTPKQDVEVSRIANELPVVALAVGAAFDFLAGTKSQAPSWMQRNGLEWSYRLAKEPKRLGSRYLWGNAVFLKEASRTLSRAQRNH